MTPDTLAAIVGRPTDELERLAAAATPGPWVPQSCDDGRSDSWYIDTHAYEEGPEPVLAHFAAIAEEFDAADGIRVFETDDGTGWQAVNDISGAVAKGATREAARANLREPVALDPEPPA